MTAQYKQNADTAPQVLIRGQTLVLTLRDAVNPVVWQMDLTHVRSSALGVVAQGDNWQVRCKTDDGNTQDVAIYKTRDQAVAVLTLVHDVLAENTRVTNKGTPDVTQSRHILLAATTLILMVVLASLLIKLIPPAPNGTLAPSTTTTQSEVGMPQNADDILENRGPTP